MNAAGHRNAATTTATTTYDAGSGERAATGWYEEAVQARETRLAEGEYRRECKVRREEYMAVRHAVAEGRASMLSDRLCVSRTDRKAWGWLARARQEGVLHVAELDAIEAAFQARDDEERERVQARKARIELAYREANAMDLVRQAVGPLTADEHAMCRWVLSRDGTVAEAVEAVRLDRGEE